MVLTIANAGRPVAKLVPIEKARRRRPGLFAGVAKLDDTFWDELPAAELALWEK